MQDEVTATNAFRSSAELAQRLDGRSDPPAAHPRIDPQLAPTSLTSGRRHQYDVVLAVNEAASNAIEHAYVRQGPADVVVVRFWTEPHHFNFYVTRSRPLEGSGGQATATAAAASRSWRT